MWTSTYLEAHSYVVSILLHIFEYAPPILFKMSRAQGVNDLEKAQVNESHTDKEPSSNARPLATRAEVEKYTFFNRKLKFDVNKHGDIYDQAWKNCHKEWAIDRFVACHLSFMSIKW